MKKQCDDVRRIWCNDATSQQNKMPTKYSKLNINTMTYMHYNLPITE